MKKMLEIIACFVMMFLCEALFCVLLAAAPSQGGGIFYWISVSFALGGLLAGAGIFYWMVIVLTGQFLKRRSE